MLTSRTRWNVHEENQESAERLADQCGIHPLIARLLLVRGYKTVEQVERFLHTEHETLYDPYLLDGMKEAVAAVRAAIREEKLIRIYGDYDADGISSTSLMIWLMRELNANFDYYIPHRVQEGYGLNKPALDQAKQDGVELIITVDTGISAYEEAQYAASIGIDMIITDHHEPPEKLPSALAVINPKKPGCPYPFKQLAGVGVAFKLAQAIMEQVPVRLTELAALGTIADLMPLADENRTLVKLGLSRMQHTSFIGLQALFHVAGLEDKEIGAGHIGFAIAPRINASGRLTSADSAVRLLTTEHEQEAYLLAKKLDDLNKERQRIVEDTVKEAVLQLQQRQHSDELPSVILVSGEDWNAGVIGIAAARILERWYRPTLVFTIDPATGIAKGSARSINGFDIYRALTECADLLDHYGGHQAAAGMSLMAERLPELERRLSQLANEWLQEEDFIPLTEVDLCCSLHDCSVELIEQLELLAPYGIGNRSPKFLLRQVSIKELRKIGKEGQHLKMTLEEQDVRLDAVGFGKSDLATHIATNSKVDVVGELQLNEWNGSRKAQLLLQDIRVEHLQVYDWRGLQPVGRLTPNGMARFAGLREDAQFVVCDDHPRWMEMITGMFGERPVHLMDAGGALTPITANADADADAAVSVPTDLVLVHLPRSKQAFQSMLARYGQDLQRVCVWFVDAETAASGCPSRERFKLIYALLKQRQTWHEREANLLQTWGRKSNLKPEDIVFIIQVFEELGFVVKNDETYEFVQQPAHRDLTESARYKSRMNAQAIAEEWMLMTAEHMTQRIKQLSSVEVIAS